MARSAVGNGDRGCQWRAAFDPAQRGLFARGSFGIDLKPRVQDQRRWSQLAHRAAHPDRRRRRTERAGRCARHDTGDQRAAGDRQLGWRPDLCGERPLPIHCRRGNFDRRFTPFHRRPVDRVDHSRSLARRPAPFHPHVGLCVCRRKTPLPGTEHRLDYARVAAQDRLQRSRDAGNRRARAAPRGVRQPLRSPFRHAPNRAIATTRFPRGRNRCPAEGCHCHAGRRCART
jgi:hypothetical protein